LKGEKKINQKHLVKDVKRPDRDETSAFFALGVIKVDWADYAFILIAYVATGGIK
jgi:hypothetical protein